MDLQVLVSTMNQIDYTLLEKMNLQSDAIVINQTDKCGFEKFQYKDYIINWINSDDRGLSKSRNLAIDNATGDICIIADDDLIYVDGYSDIIIEQFERHPDADIIVFQIEGINKKFKKYHPKLRKVNYLTSMKVSSVEIAFRLKSIQKYGVRFSELFGSGSRYYMGEESIFLFDCLKNGSNILYVPVKIADLYIGDSSWFEGYNRNYFISRGAVFTRMSRKFSLLFILQFAIRKHSLYCDEITLLESIKYMMEGRRQYLNNINMHTP